MRADVKAFTRWVIARGYSVRFHRRTPTAVMGILTTPDGPINFVYDPVRRTINLTGANTAPEQVEIDEYGWPLKHEE